jgi:AAA+ superfamily predicted ATPase
VFHECLRLGYEYRFVTPDEYRAARGGRDPAREISRLFEFDRAGVVFFDDMDVALRNRDTSGDAEDQAVFLSALDGIEGREGVVYMFTTNCPLARIDPAFKRPGRLDVVLHFPPPDAALRRCLYDRWHPEVRAGLDPDVVVADTAGHSFAEIEELKNLVVMRYVDEQVWDWAWARRQFMVNREELVGRARDRITGFAAGINGTGQV